MYDHIDLTRMCRIAYLETELAKALAIDAELRLERDRYASKFFEAEMLLEERGWQPIATAPKDGTRVDLWHSDHGRIANGHWHDNVWKVNIGGLLWTSSKGEFTHWMPIPNGPEDK